MTSTGQNITMVAGDDKLIYITVYNDDGGIDPITGSTVNWVVFRQNGTIVITKATPDIDLDTPSDGVLLITLVPADTENLLGNYFHECEVIDSGNRTSTVTKGFFKVERSYA